MAEAYKERTRKTLENADIDDLCFLYHEYVDCDPAILAPCALYLRDQLRKLRADKYAFRLRELSALEKGWIDGEQGEKVTEAAISAALRIMKNKSSDYDVVRIFPTENGGIDFALEEDGASIEIEVYPDGSSDLDYEIG